MVAKCGGRPCDQEGVTERVEQCNEDPCPERCIWSSWDPWGDWSTSYNIIEARTVTVDTILKEILSHNIFHLMY